MSFPEHKYHMFFVFTEVPKHIGLFYIFHIVCPVLKSLAKKFWFIVKSFLKKPLIYHEAKLKYFVFIEEMFFCTIKTYIFPSIRHKNMRQKTIKQELLKLYNFSTF